MQTNADVEECEMPIIMKEQNLMSEWVNRLNYADNQIVCMCVCECAIQLGIELNLVYFDAIPFSHSLSFSCFSNICLYISIYLCWRSCSQNCDVPGQKYFNSNNLDFFISRNMPIVLCCWPSVSTSSSLVVRIFFRYCMQCICVQMRWHNIEINQ